MISILHDKVKEFEPILITDEIIKEYPELKLNILSNEKKDTMLLYREKDIWFYCKRPYYEFILAYLINELIGMYYAKLLGADTVEYSIRRRVSNKYFTIEDLYLLSENFWTKDSIETSKLMKKECIFLEELKDLILKVNNFSKFRNDELDSGIMKMTAIDIVMNQTDRDCHKNSTLVNSNGKILLGKLFDYEFSYDESDLCIANDYYINPFLIVRLNEKGITKIFEEFKCAYPIFKTISQIELEYILSLIERDYPIIIGDEHKKKLLAKDSEYRKVINRVL